MQAYRFASGKVAFWKKKSDMLPIRTTLTKESYWFAFYFLILKFFVDIIRFSYQIVCRDWLMTLILFTQKYSIFLFSYQIPSGQSTKMIYWNYWFLQNDIKLKCHSSSWTKVTWYKRNICYKVDKGDDAPHRSPSFELNSGNLTLCRKEKWLHINRSLMS